ncbi:MAG: hypothetical protein Alpg2KO_05950 [Alphaproteobacteria bacterium]
MMTGKGDNMVDNETMSIDYTALAQLLEQRHPDADRLNLEQEKLRHMIARIPGQSTVAAKLDSDDLEAVMTAWIDLEGDDAL